MNDLIVTTCILSLISMHFKLDQHAYVRCSPWTTRNL